MTTRKDNFNTRVNDLGEAREKTTGVSNDGFGDPTNEYPKRDYHLQPSTNKAAKGVKINRVFTGGGDIGVPLGIEDQLPSRYPFNDVHETPSGHVVEYDDTPGGERILIKHRTGAGVEMRADGTMIISSLKNKVEITGADQTLIVEGEGNLVYKGNLNLQVTGDFNVDVGGNYTVQTAGEKRETIKGSDRKRVNGNSESVVIGTQSEKSLGDRIALILGDNYSITKGNVNEWIEGSYEQAIEESSKISAKTSYAVSSNISNITGDKLSLIGKEGVIGGDNMEFTGSVYMGKSGALEYSSGATFWGSFKGQATEAIRASTAVQATSAGTAGSLGAGGTGTPLVGSQESNSPTKDIPISAIITDYLTNGSYGIKSVSVDTNNNLKNRLTLADRYNGCFISVPTMQEIRSTIRDPQNRSALGPLLVSENRLNSEYVVTVPLNIGRTVNKTPSSRFGFTPIGNAVENRGKRFIPK